MSKADEMYIASLKETNKNLIVLHKMITEREIMPYLKSGKCLLLMDDLEMLNVFGNELVAKIFTQVCMSLFDMISIVQFSQKFTCYNSMLTTLIAQLHCAYKLVLKQATRITTIQQ